MPEPSQGEGRAERPRIDPKSLEANRRRYEKSWNAVADALSRVEAEPEHMVSALRWIASEIENEGFVRLWNGQPVPTPERTARVAQREASLEQEKQRARVVAHIAHRWRVCLAQRMIDSESREAAVASLKYDGFGDIGPMSPIEKLEDLALEAVVWAEDAGYQDLFTEAYGRKTLESTLRKVKHQDGNSVYAGDLDETMTRVISWATNESPFLTARTARRVPVPKGESRGS